ncbi:MAG: SIS domain-containing protein [Anaerolineales bacterium]|nr:SIS domain-containing protein [Anaerolineales bacterium]
MSLHSEIFEQPARLEALLGSQRTTVEEIARAIRARGVAFAFLAARGTSDNAGRYANYLWGSFNRLPMALATPSLFTYYQQPPLLKDALVVGISQSGMSPDILAVLEEGRHQGCLTLAITNAPGSPLAKCADYVLDIQAGPEMAVAATKTYTAELLAIAMLSAALSGSEQAWRDLQLLPQWIERVFSLDESLALSAQRYRYMSQCVVLGRGYNYATAFEWALKLKELTYVEAEPYSSADFQHGPIAMVASGFPVFAVAPQGRVFHSMLEVLRRLRDDLSADLLVISNEDTALELAHVPVRLPAEIPEWLTPIIGIVPAQLLAYHLTQAKGYDTEKPRSIRKVTETQ